MSENIKEYPFKHGLPLEFEIIDLSKVFESKKNMMTVPHRAQFYHILWLEKGEGTHFIDFNPVQVEDNSILFIPHNCVNLFDKDGRYEGKSIIFTDSFFCKNEQDAQFLHASEFYSELYGTASLKTDTKDSELGILFEAMEKEFARDKDEMQYSILHNLLHVFLLKAEREMRRQGFNQLKPSIHLDHLLLFKSLLESRFKEERMVSKYAAEQGISEKQLHKATTTLLDKTPKQLIDERVMLEAKRLLVHSHQSVKGIAYDLGFEEPTYFIKYFRKHAHTTPAEFRENY
ncbi:helix-turn-helix domain-containing protein [Carboxylicivirga mesophila]|uniref:Helix-turn-helix domain-containing protein n=1 Tax=Carboxylicivirga mesophila TaxID=1166478 RepID=A0ABS5KAE7_9BACT|nr:helix-turn-helix transcriptional regulator [Carboxylicivirga mesophila]MBS2212004.1 helix-turn-helix domain-containing protein [Carboxylicivirga mesophila]